MPFNTLLLTCLKHGTSFQDPDPDARGKVRMEPGKGETILFFPIDDQQQRNAPCLMRQKLRLSEEPVCEPQIFQQETKTKGTSPDDRHHHTARNQR
jgi:hypothetical protein